MDLNILNPARKVKKKLQAIIVNFFRYYDRRVVFIYKNFLKGKDKSITEILTAFRMQKTKNVRNEHDFFFTFGHLVAIWFFKIVIMGNRMFTVVKLIFHNVASWGRLMVFIFTCAWGCRRQKINFLRLILSKTLSHCRCTFNILKFNHFSFQSTYFFYQSCSISFYSWLSLIRISREKCLSLN